LRKETDISAKMKPLIYVTVLTQPLLICMIIFFEPGSGLSIDHPLRRTFYAETKCRAAGFKLWGVTYFHGLLLVK
jgi:hypothetical protein